MDEHGYRDTVEWYNQNADQYALTSFKAHSIHDKEQLTQFVNLLRKGARVLDAGCGAGRDTNLLKKSGINATGLDLSKGLIQVASDFYPEITFAVGNMLDLPFQDDTFDGIWAHASLLHFETLEKVKKAMYEFARVMKPNGILHVLVKAQTGDTKTEVINDPGSTHDRFFQYFTQYEVQALIDVCGFDLINIRQYNDSEGYPQGWTDNEWIVALAAKR